MDRIVYVNGDFVPQADAKVSVFDRGFLFGDGVYEVIPVLNSRLVEAAHAVARLERSMGEIGLAWPCAKEDYLPILEELRKRNGITEGSVYMQVSRGVAERDFAFPANTPSSFVAFTSARRIIDNPLAKSGVAVVSVPDLRWKRRDIKSLNLLAQCLAKQEAVSRGAFEGWMHEDGHVTEGASSSAFIVKGDKIITRALSNAILPGIRRKVIMQLAREHDIALEERAFTLEEAIGADEAFLSSATTLVMPVISIDGRPVADGKPGRVTLLMRSLYVELLLQEANA
ncbi:MAG: D-amino-acid transaminase [Gammaproteobacteria bacterium]|nr:D-amino-acid transaminase [Pseudomonadales bacterium]MCP5329501.1 D-amino-acid transaminase [Pseudomonadales bacterium]